MRLDPVDPPRRFEVGGEALAHVADLELEPGELVTLRAAGTEYDVTRKEWGWYATPSLNGRARDHGLRGALCRNGAGQAFAVLVETGREDAFAGYLQAQGMKVLCWLDSDAAVERLGHVLGA